MSDLRPPSFPYVGVFLCVACVGAAAWLPLKYWYCWEVTPRDLIEGSPPIGLGAWENCYVRLRGHSRISIRGGGWMVIFDPKDWWPFVEVCGGLQQGRLRKPPITGRVTSLLALAAEQVTTEEIPFIDETGNISGSHRIPGSHEYLHETSVSTRPLVDAASGRWTAAPIAGLVVGAMGVFVFTVALRHWLGERRKFLADIQGHNTYQAPDVKSE